MITKPPLQKPEEGDDTFPIFQAGVDEGKLVARRELLTWLEKKYLDMTVPKDDPSMQAVLKLARETSEFLDSRTEK